MLLQHHLKDSLLPSSDVSLNAGCLRRHESHSAPFLLQAMWQQLSKLLALNFNPKTELHKTNSGRSWWTKCAFYLALALMAIRVSWLVIRGRVWRALECCRENARMGVRGGMLAFLHDVLLGKHACVCVCVLAVLLLLLVAPKPGYVLHGITRIFRN